VTSCVFVRSGSGKKKRTHVWNFSAYLDFLVLEDSVTYPNYRKDFSANAQILYQISGSVALKYYKLNK
jgi:hypothetical protein